MTSPPFTIQETVRFRHCDPAGIVFYPRYFEMINDSVETYFAQVVGLPFSGLHETGAVPTVAIEAEFRAPSRIADVLSISLTPLQLGRTSLKLQTRATCNGQVRFLSTSTLVLTNGDGTPQPWPQSVATNLDIHPGDSHDT